MTTTVMTDLALPQTFVRTAPAAELPLPPATTGALGWLRANLFSGPLNVLSTFAIAALLFWLVPPVLRFLIVDAVWAGADRDACLATQLHPHVGACWAFVHERLGFFTYGSYPVDERWRVDVFFALLALGIAWMLWLDAPRRGLGAIYFFAALPIVSFILLHGFPLIGLSTVDTSSWGGMLVTVVVTVVGIVTSLPLGIALALGRRSDVPAVRFLSTGFIELVRAVPLITVLFMASVLLPYFVPEKWAPDKLLRALVGVALFASAYMAEVVRAGLQSIPKGQYEAVHAVGLSRWHGLSLVILPQALRVTIPNIVNNYIALFKDTTLVFFVGIFDFLKAVEVSRVDPKWATPNTGVTGYAFAALVYFAGCYAMSLYARAVERRVTPTREA